VRIFLFVFFLFFVGMAHANPRSCRAFYKNTFSGQKVEKDGAAFQLLKTEKFIGQLDLPGDRIVVRLTPDINGLQKHLLSQEGRNNVEKFITSIDPLEVLKDLSDRFNLHLPDITNLLSMHGDSLIREIFEARNKQDWEQVIHIYDDLMPQAWQKVSESKLQAALALNRRNKGRDRSRAIQLSEEVIALSDNRGLLGEAYGIRARIFKDQHDEIKSKMPNSPLVAEYFEAAIRTYQKGFAANPLDYYPGIAALNLMVTRKDERSMAEVKSFSMRVQMAVNTTLKRFKEQNQIPDFWLLSTALQLQVYRHDWQPAFAMLEEVISTSGGSHNLQSQIDNFLRLRTVWETSSSVSIESIEKLDQLIDRFKSGLQQPGRIMPLAENSPSYITSRSFPNMENAFLTKPFTLKSEIAASGIESELRQAAKASKVKIQSFHKFLQKSKNTGSEKAAPVLLAPTGPYKPVVKTISDQVDMTTWWDAYQQLGLKLDPTNSAVFIEKLLSSGRDIYLLVPKDFQSVHLDSYTYEEFKILLKYLPTHSAQIHFVFGFENVYPLNWAQRVSEREVHQNYQKNVMTYFTQQFQDWLRKLGDNVKNYDF
jgi:hypothetical protein